MRKAAFIVIPVALIAVLAVAALSLGVGVQRAAAQHPATAPAEPYLAHHSFPRIHGNKNSTSSNWSGYASTGTTYTDVKGTWVEPTANCSGGQTGYSSFWVGIDGDGTNSVEQLGTDADCSGSTPVYYGWWEMYPKASVNLSTSAYPVAPGDTITAEVSSSSKTSFTLTMHSSRGWTFTTNQTSRRASRGSAEWIAEAPSSSGGVLPLANFGTVNFTGCTANGVGIASDPNPDAITMAANGVTKATPSGLTGGDSFSVSWSHS